MLKFLNNNKKDTWKHQWAIPILHSFLWILGLLITTDLFDVQHQYFPNEISTISLGTVIAIFIAEVIITFIDAALEHEDKVLNITFCNYVALFLSTILLSIILMFLACHFCADKDLLAKLFIGLLVLLSAFTKGMEIWLQNNWNRYALDKPKLPELGYYSLNNQK